jgi:hypothetical protein
MNLRTWKSSSRKEINGSILSQLNFPSTGELMCAGWMNTRIFRLLLLAAGRKIDPDIERVTNLCSRKNRTLDDFNM